MSFFHLSHIFYLFIYLFNNSLSNIIGIVEKQRGSFERQSPAWRIGRAKTSEDRSFLRSSNEAAGLFDLVHFTSHLPEPEVVLGT